MNGKIHDKNTDFLFQAILALETPEECYRFFDDLCAVTELRTLECSARSRCTATLWPKPAPLPPPSAG